MPRAGRIAPLFLVAAVLVSSSWAQVAIPRFGTRGDVPPTLVEEFATALRAGVRAVGGLDVTEADLITPGIAGSLDPESAVFVAESVRFAVSGEMARVGPEGTPEPFRINLIVLDAREGRSTDLINRPLHPEGTAEIAREYRRGHRELHPTGTRSATGKFGAVYLQSASPGRYLCERILRGEDFRGWDPRACAGSV